MKYEAGARGKVESCGTSSDDTQEEGDTEDELLVAARIVELEEIAVISHCDDCPCHHAGVELALLRLDGYRYLASSRERQKTYDDGRVWPFVFSGDKAGDGGRSPY